MRKKNSQGSGPLLKATVKHNRGLEALTLLAIVINLAACAVRTNGAAGAQYSIDEAALLGRQITEFTLPDGSEASLRLHNGHYSVKFNRYSRVVDIDKAVSVKFKSTALVDGYSLVILEKSEANCAKMTELLAVRGSEVRVWDLGNCQSDPQLSISSSDATFDIRDGSMVTRYVFQDGQLRYGNLPYQAPQYEQQKTPAVASHPAAVQATKTSTPPEKTEAAPRSKPSGKKVATARFEQPIIPNAMPTFQTKERSPKTIYLDK
jgi:hypothetical protein